MISIGYRLTDDVFPAPEEKIAKISDTDPKMMLNGIQEVDGEKKTIINRIVLTRSAIVEVLRAESPSRIWVRLQNHITDTTLTFREPFDLVPVKRVQIGDYALAPNEDRSFRRCRILERGKDLLKIFFIDDAVVCWVKEECLADIPEHFTFFPWQAIQVSMVGVYPLASLNGTDTWSSETCDQFRAVLNQFPLLNLKVVLSSVVFNDYAKPIAVNVFGMKSDTDTNQVNVADILMRSVSLFALTDVVNDAAAHEVFELTDDEHPEVSVALEMHTKWPDNWKRSDGVEDEQNNAHKQSENAVEDAEWDPRRNHVPMSTVAQILDGFTFPDPGQNKRIMMAVEGRCTKSAFEWYARPIVKTGRNEVGEMVAWNEQKDLREVDKVDWMLAGNEKLLAFAEQLDTYYSNPKNRKPLTSEKIKSLQNDGLEVFAVCAVNEEKAMYTGEWQRVMIINCHDFAEVRFLDSGGRDMVLTGSLYCIHEQHCRLPPMCLQFSMHGVTTRNKKGGKKWILEEVAHFKMCLREDVPIFIDVDDLASMDSSTVSDERPYMSRHVFLARDVKYMDDSMSLINRFVGTGIGCAARANDEPVPWPSGY